MACVTVIVGLMTAGQMGLLPHLDSYTQELRGPARLAVAPDDTLLVADPLNRHIVLFDAFGEFAGTWSVPEVPVGVAAHPDGRIFVSLRETRAVAIYDSGFNFIEYLGAGNPLVPFIGPTDIDIASDTGRIYVVDADADRVYAFESDGSLALILGARGSWPGEFLYPGAIAIDESRQRIIVADHDNFRVQMFTTAGVFMQQFGERLTSSGGSAEGWMPRPAGLAVDADGMTFLSDALMGTVRMFDPGGAELGKVVEHGDAPGNLRAACDVALSNDGTRLYVVSSNSSRVEVFDATGALAECSQLAPEPVAGRPSKATGVRAGRLARRAATPSDRVSLPELFTIDGIGSFPEALLAGWDGPHIVEDRPDICWPCHGITGQPGGHAGTVEGQAALCTSCHNTGGRALRIAINESGLSDPFGTNPGADDGRGRSHAWGVPAVNPAADAVGPVPGGAMAMYLDGEGRIKCATCHNQHNSEQGQPYLRRSNDTDQMCKECHAPRDLGPGDGGSHAVGFTYPAGQGEYPVESELASLFIKSGNVECMTCHAPHGADSGGANNGDGDGMLLREANNEILCQACHTEHLTHDAVGDWQPTCGDCHDIHDPGSDNVNLIAQEVNGLPVSYGGDAAACDGVSDFVHGVCAPPAYDGICEVCHTTTAFHRNDATGDHQHHTQMRCTVCHPHGSGFLASAASCTTCHGEPPNGTAYPNRSGSHAVHFTGANGPGVTECTTCHASPDTASHMNGVPSFASGSDINFDGNIDLVEADVCDRCHSSGGAFDGVNDPVTGAKANWRDGVYDGDRLKPEKRNWCVGCHDTEGAVVNLVTAPPVAGDNKTWGYNVAAHGQNLVFCTDCHDPTLPHTDGQKQTFSLRFPLSPGGEPHSPEEREIDRAAYNSGYRLRLIDGEQALAVPREASAYTAAEHRLCFSCHDEVKLLGVPADYYTPILPPPYLQIPIGAVGTDYRNEYEWGHIWEGEPGNAHWQHIAVAGMFWDVDQDGFFSDSSPACVTCHNPHGAVGRLTIALTSVDLAITYGVFHDVDVDRPYGFIGSGAYLEVGGDLHCMSCHPYFGAGEDPPSFELHTRYYRDFVVP